MPGNPTLAGPAPQDDRHDALVVDADDFFRDMTANAFVHAGFRVRRAAALDEAIAALQERSPNVVVLDLALPDEGAYEILAAMQRAPALQAIPVIALARADSDLVWRAESLGARSVLIKEHLSPGDIVAVALESMIVARKKVSPELLFIVATLAFAALFIGIAMAVIARA